MRQVTQADFLARALEVHGDRYDYSRAIYSGSNSKLTIVCRTHGPFEQTPSNHYKGKGCRACAGVQPYTLQSFVDRARSLHGDRYGYAEALLVNALTPLTIRCSVHGLFEQTPRRHLSGGGCPKCAITLGADRQRGTADSFIAKAHSVHGDRYDYSRVAYAATHTKVVIVCPEHGPFEQTPAAHQRGAGCPACAGVARLDTSSFVARARAIHGQRFGYERTVYSSTASKLVVTCPEHGDFEIHPSVHLRANGGGGCRSCMAERLSTRFSRGTAGFVADARKAHGDKYDYSAVEYVNKELEVVIACPVHGEFRQRAGVHITGGECPACSYAKRGDKQRMSEGEFLGRARAAHGDRYDYGLLSYAGMHDYVTIVCPEHGPFEQVANSHMRGCGCPSCAEHGFDPDQPATVYVLVVIGDEGGFTGYGITRDLDTRLRAHRKNLSDAGWTIARLHFAEFAHGRDALDVEALIKETFELTAQEIDGFRTEATHPCNYEKIIRIVDERKRKCKGGTSVGQTQIQDQGGQNR
ncbi:MULTISPECIES: GIY-YIG nuclease family protein [Cupriavidus]|uniref:GIY-YIG nuclease family protein n=1 Tax=Cupriavidus TaxID=106589 RepID=UPI0004AE3EED|nr:MULTISPECIES: GIY-YIG nuclease family protein [Cupriavidus]